MITLPLVTLFFAFVPASLSMEIDKDFQKKNYHADSKLNNAEIEGKPYFSKRSGHKAETESDWISFNNNIATNISQLEDGPPPAKEVAKMARYIVRKSNWTVMSTVSNRNPIEGYPFGNIFSVSDGPIGKSTGIPYMYLTPYDMTVVNLEKDNRASLTMTLAQTDYCRQKNYDPEDPRCARVILTGHFTKIANSSSEYEFAKMALFTKHIAMSHWPTNHGWFFGKLNITNIIVQDSFGGVSTVPLEDYYNSN